VRTRGLQILAIACLLLGTAALVADDKGKKDIDALQGTWNVESFKQDGMDAPEDFVKKVTFVIKDDKYSIKAEGNEVETGTIKLDPDKKPKTIDFDITAGDDKGKKQLGIYTLDGDKFTFCMAHPGATERPTKMESTKNSQTVLSVLKRAK